PPVDLPAPGLTVALSPDGTYAAVGHDKAISYINLITGLLEKNIAVRNTVKSVAVGSTGFIYVVSDADSHISSVEISTGREIGTLYISPPYPTLVMHPNGHRLYAISSSELAESDVSGGPHTRFTRDRASGDLFLCSKGWLSNDSLRVFTACGQVLR